MMLKLIIQIVYAFFGFPGLERYQGQKVIVVTSRRETKGTHLLLVFVKRKNTKSCGWQLKSSIKNKVYSRKVPNLCTDTNSTETITDCISIKSLTDDLSEIVASVNSVFGRYLYKVNDSNWTDDFAHS